MTDKMLTYETAKKLKEAGFPQEGNPFGREDKVYYPTLSELIEECGNEFYILIRRDFDEGIPWRGEKPHFISAWSAQRAEDVGAGIPYPTPEEAVAALWLELKGNK